MLEIDGLIALLSADPIALSFFFLLLPVFSLGLNKLAEGQGNTEPYASVYSALIYAAAMPGIISLTFWVYSLFFQSKRLDELDLFVYYLPPVVMLTVFFIVRQNAKIKTLPWFGELYELLSLIATAAILTLLSFDVLPLTEYWQAALIFALIFIIAKLIWERFQRFMRARF